MESNCTVLIIDDEESILHALKRVLSKDSYNVIVSSNPGEVMNLLKTEDVDAIISDINMPEINGLELAETIQEEYPFIPIILITGNPNLTTAQQAVRRKAFDYIPKPVERSKILEVVKRAIEYKKKSTRNAQESEAYKFRAETLSKKNEDLNIQNSIILNTTQEFIITVLTDGTIHSLNHSAEVVFSSPNRPLIGKHLSVLFPADKREEYLRRMRLIYYLNHENTRHAFEADFLDKNDNPVTCEISFCKYFIDGVEYYTGIFRDVSYKKILTQKLLESEKRAFLNTIAASIGHEMNNALTAIMGFVELAMEPNADPTIKDTALNMTYTQGEKLRNLTSNLLTIENSQDRFREESNNETDLNLALDSVMEVFFKSKRVKNCLVTIEKQPKLPPIRGNQDKIELVLSNLILNAADATENSGSINIRTFRDSDGYANFEVMDNGMGMSEEVLEKMYEPYFSTKEIGKGTGLGMFVVKEISRIFKIKLTVESTVGKGSKFLLRFSHPKIQEV